MSSGEDPTGPGDAADDAGYDGEEASTPFVITTPDDPASGRDWYLWAGLLALLVFVAYLPAIHGTFLWDDSHHVSENHKLESFDGLIQIWTDPKSEPQYYPLTHTTFWIEHQLWGKNPLGYHITNLLLHALSTILVWRILRRMSVPGAWAAAALWAIHPLQAESVSWISERKNVLSGLLFFASIWFYLDFSEIAPPEEDPNRPFRLIPDEWGAYAVALVLFVMALLSKSVTSAMPAVMFVMFWWQGKLTRKNALGLIPFFALGLGMGGLTAYLERNGVESAVGPDWDFSFAQRILIAGHALWFYVGKLVVPIDLMFSYPKFDIDTGNVLNWLYPIAALALIIGLWAARKTIGRAPLAAALWFGICLFPSLGFFNLYPMRYTFVADHYQYLAGLGLIVLVVGSVASLFRRIEPKLVADEMTTAAAAESPEAVPPVPARTQWSLAVTAVTILAVAGTAWYRSQVFDNPVSLWRDTLAKNDQSWIATYDLGVQLDAVAAIEKNDGNFDDASKDLDEALSLFDRTMKLRPEHEKLHTAIGHALWLRSQLAQAVAATQPSAPLAAGADSYLAMAKEQFRLAIRQGEAAWDRAKTSGDPALMIHSEIQFQPYLFLGMILTQEKDFAGAMPLLQTAADLADATNPRTGERGPAHYRSQAHYYLAQCLVAAGQFDKALDQAAQAAQADPQYADAQLALAKFLNGGKHEREAYVQLQKYITAYPHDPEGYNQMGIWLARNAQTERDVAYAITFFDGALQLSPNFTEAKHNKEMLQDMVRKAHAKRRAATTQATTEAIGATQPANATQPVDTAR